MLSPVTVEQIQRLERMAIEQYGIPSIMLMENAGRATAVEVLKDLKRRKQLRATIVCGLGNNAGDGFVAARHLWNAGVAVTVFLIGRSEQLKKDAATNFLILKKCGYPVREIQAIDSKILRIVKRSDMIVDAIFGVGLNRPLAEPFRCVIENLNSLKKKIIAVDIPSGLDGTTGKIWGACIHAAATVTFSFPKKGFYGNAGPTHTGQVIVADIGIPKKVISCKW